MLIQAFRVSSHYWNNHNHNHNHKRFGQFLAKKFEILLMICDKRKNIISQTYCEITNLLWYHKPIVIFQNGLSNLTNLLWISKIDWKTQTNKYNCPVFTQTGRKTIGMWTFVKLQQVDVFKTMLIQKKQCSAQLSQ